MGYYFDLIQELGPRVEGVVHCAPSPMTEIHSMSKWIFKGLAICPKVRVWRLQAGP